MKRKTVNLDLNMLSFKSHRDSHMVSKAKKKGLNDNPNLGDIRKRASKV